MKLLCRMGYATMSLMTFAEIGNAFPPPPPIWLYVCNDLSQNVRVEITKDYPDNQSVGITVQSQVPAAFYKETAVRENAPSYFASFVGSRFHLTVDKAGGLAPVYVVAARIYDKEGHDSLALTCRTDNPCLADSACRQDN